MAGSLLRLSGFSLGPFGATLGAVASVVFVEGGTEALGFTFSRCLFLPLSRVGAGLVRGGTDAAGVASGETFSFGLFLFLPGVIAGLTLAVALGAGETPAGRLF